MLPRQVPSRQFRVLVVRSWQVGFGFALCSIGRSDLGSLVPSRQATSGVALCQAGLIGRPGGGTMPALDRACCRWVRFVKFLVFPSSGDLEPVDMSGRVLFVVWALVADRVFTGGHSSGFASCLAGRSGRLDAHVRSGLLKVEQQGSIRLGGGTGFERQVGFARR